MFLIDTNVVTDLISLNGNPGVRRWANTNFGSASLPCTVIFELRMGVALLPDGRRRDDLTSAIERMIARFGPRVIALDRAAADLAGELVGVASRQGRVLKAMDAQIAGIAGAYGLTLVTRNVKDFEVLGIDLLNPWGDRCAD